MMKETLTKENFWNDIQNQFPAEMEAFRIWLDAYKAENNWRSLFPIVQRSGFWVDVKYHSLPLAMQFGIFIEYALTTDVGYCFELFDFDIERAKSHIRRFFELQSIP